jgi:hypothetical protein
VHQFVTFTVHTPSQVAFAEFVSRDPSAAALPAFYQAKRDRFLALTRVRASSPSACEGTYFQLMDYSAISTEGDTDRAVAEWLLKDPRRRGHPGLGVQLQGRGRPGAAVLLREEGGDAGGRGRAASPHRH